MATRKTKDPQQFEELLLQGLETELGGVEIYKLALKCVVNGDLKEEWEKYLEETQEHVQIMTDLVTKVGLDPNKMTPGRQVVKHIGESLCAAM
jgi:rubrerythrin